MTNQHIQPWHGPANRFVFDGVDSLQAEHRPVVILGGGPAGLTAALYAARANLEPLVLQGAEPGASAKYLGLANEQRLVGRGVSACATCDGAFFREQEVAVVGGGDAAMEEALFLTRFATRVYVIHRRDALRASQIMQDRALAHPKITFMWNTMVEDVLGDEAVEGLRLRHVQTDERSTLPVSGLFVAIGHQPNTAVFQGWLEMDELGYIRTQTGSAHTSVAGVFAAGDVQDRVYRQAVTAAGSGAMAAIDAERWLAEHEALGAPQTAARVG